MTRTRAGRVRRLLLPATHGDAGNAVLEFLFLAVLLMVPLVYVLLTVFTVQRAAYAVSSASREAGRVFVAADSAALGRARAEAATAIVLGDSGLGLGPASLDLACSVQPCLTPGATVTSSSPTPWSCRLRRRCWPTRSARMAPPSR